MHRVNSTSLEPWSRQITGSVNIRQRRGVHISWKSSMDCWPVHMYSVQFIRRTMFSLLDAVNAYLQWENKKQKKAYCIFI